MKGKLLSLLLMINITVFTHENITTDAVTLDQEDPIAFTKDLFNIPKGVVHFGGHSLGPTYQGSVERVLYEYKVRDELILGGHFHTTHPASEGFEERGRHWFDCDRNEKALTALSQMIGASSSELVMGNSLTVNNVLMVQAFYMPNIIEGRFKILLMEHSFASDQAVLMSVLRQKLQLLKQNGVEFDLPEDPMEFRRAFVIELKSDANGLYDLNTFRRILDSHGGEIALAHLEAIPFTTGQRFYQPEVTKLLKNHGIRVGWDLAHMVGNRRVHLSEDGVDYATWCGYKYLTASAGGVGGYFIHQDNVPFKDYFPAQGWKAMKSDLVFQAIHSWDPTIFHKDARGTRLGNPPPIAMADAQAMLELYHDLGIENVEVKSEKLTSFLINALRNRLGNKIEWITPLPKKQRGAMLVFKLHTKKAASEIEDELHKRGFAVDVRPPANIRIMPHPLYTTYKEVEDFASVLAEVCQ
ncbi:MAG: Kynureninase [Chlamydiia bacterium]|nr:Kynureninase [Chlamydiia bacterium]